MLSTDCVLPNLRLMAMTSVDYGAQNYGTGNSTTHFWWIFVLDLTEFSFCKKKKEYWGA